MNKFKCCAVFFALLMSLFEQAAANDVVEINRDVSTQNVFVPVIVRGLLNPAVASYERLLRGVESFVVHHSLAPSSKLRFRVYDRSEAKTPMSLRYEGESKVLAIDVDSEGYFTLPGEDEIGTKEGDLVSNRRTGELQIVPDIETPGFSSLRRRLGIMSKTQFEKRL